MSFNIKNGDELIPIAGTPKVTRSSLELENVDNTADLDKPVSTATQAALDLKADITDLDKKANKTFIESTDNETHVVTVPEDVTGFAAVGKICGKTVKSKNLFYLTKTGTATVSGVDITYNDDNSFTINGTASSSCTFSIMGGASAPLDIFPNNTYSLIWTTKSGDSDATGVALKLGNKASTAYDGEATSVNRIFTITGEIGYIYFRASSGKVFNNLTIYPMLVKGTATDAEYEPYHEDLWNAPVESVVSQGKNLFDGTWVDMYVDSGTLQFKDDSTTSYSAIVKCEPNTTYTISKQDTSNRFRIATSSTKPVVSGYANKIVNNTHTLTEFTFTTQATDEYIFVFAGADANPGGLQIEKSSEKTQYSPYTKTTVSIPQEILDLPDYGVESNVVDFENGTYTHNKTISNGEVVDYTGADKIIDISSILYPFKVESGGTITFENEHNLDVQNTVLYKKEVL